MPTDTIFFEDLADAQFPYDEVEEMEAEDFGRCAGCQVVPHPRPEECTR